MLKGGRENKTQFCSVMRKKWLAMIFTTKQNSKGYWSNCVNQ